MRYITWFYINSPTWGFSQFSRPIYLIENNKNGGKILLQQTMNGFYSRPLEKRYSDANLYKYEYCFYLNFWLKSNQESWQIGDGKSIIVGHLILFNSNRVKLYCSLSATLDECGPVGVIGLGIKLIPCYYCWKSSDLYLDRPYWR